MSTRQTIINFFILLFIITGSTVYAQSGAVFVPIGSEGLPVSHLKADPVNCAVMYAAVNMDDGNSIIKSNDGGNTWLPLSYVSVSIHCFEINPNDTDILYIGSSNGIYKSTNGGSSWNGTPISTAENIGCNALIINKTNSDIIYGYYYYYDYREEEHKYYFIKSVDGGKNWTTLKINTGGKQYYFNSFGIDCSDYQTLYITARQIISGTDIPHLLRSKDGGINWEIVDISTFVSPGNGVYNLFVDENGTIFLGVGGSGIYKSTDNGDSWMIQVSFHYYFSSLHFYPDNPNFLSGVCGDMLYVSTNGGISWNATVCSSESGNIRTELCTSESEYLIGNNVGIYKTTDGGITWTNKYSAPSNAEISALTISKSNSDIICKISDEAFFISFDGGSNWQEITSLTSYSVKSSFTPYTFSIDETSPNTLYAWDYSSFSSMKISIKKSVDYGTTWQRLLPLDMTNNSHSYNIKAKGNLVRAVYSYGSFANLLSSTDGGVNWSEKIITTVDVFRPFIEVDPSDDSKIYICGSLEEYNNYKGSIWKSLGTGEFLSVYEMPLGTIIHSIAVNPLNTTEVYFCATNGIYKSTNEGLTWRKIYTTTCTALHIDSKGIIYVATYYGIIISHDNGDTWETYSDGLTGLINPRCLAVNEKENKVYVGTKDKGIFLLDLSTSTKIRENENKIPAELVLLQNYPNPFNQHTVIRYQVSGVRGQGLGISGQVSGGMRVKLEIYNILGQLVTTLVDEEKMPGEYRILWDGKNMRGEDLPTGIYFYRMQTGDFSEVKKMILLR